MLIIAAAAALGLGLVGPVLAQATSDDPLPPGPGKDVVVRVCTSCHDASEFAFARKSPDEWETEINKMESAGAEMTGDEETTISAYLSKYLGKAAPGAPPAPAPGAPTTPDAPPAAATPPAPPAPGP
ncbi:MAG TPA: hypothetical protein VHV27_08485 [Phenylobacterium sp.]|nr:hypothetical protein [Phenylobacterium sp.]